MWGGGGGGLAGAACLAILEYGFCNGRLSVMYGKLVCPYSSRHWHSISFYAVMIAQVWMIACFCKPVDSCELILYNIRFTGVRIN